MKFQCKVTEIEWNIADGPMDNQEEMLQPSLLIYSILFRWWWWWWWVGGGELNREGRLITKPDHQRGYLLQSASNRTAKASSEATREWTTALLRLQLLLSRVCRLHARPPKKTCSQASNLIELLRYFALCMRQIPPGLQATICFSINLNFQNFWLNGKYRYPGVTSHFTFAV